MNEVAEYSIDADPLFAPVKRRILALVLATPQPAVPERVISMPDASGGMSDVTLPGFQPEPVPFGQVMQPIHPYFDLVPGSLLLGLYAKLPEGVVMKWGWMGDPIPQVKAMVDAGLLED